MPNDGNEPGERRHEERSLEKVTGDAIQWPVTGRGGHLGKEDQMAVFLGGVVGLGMEDEGVWV